MNQTEIDLKTSEGRDKHWLIGNVGKRIGSRSETHQQHYWYVLDGKVFRTMVVCSEVTEVMFVGDYFEFCDTLRKGEVVGFTPANNFHLNGRGEKLGW